MSGELPYDRELDAQHAQRRRDEAAQAARVKAAGQEIRSAAGIAPGRKRPPGSAPATQHRQLVLTIDELNRLTRAAQAVGLTLRDFLRGAGLAYAKRVEGK